MNKEKVSFFNRSNIMDLTQGAIFSQLMIFALPLLAGQVLQTLYNSVDSIVIGQLESAQALAAVNASASISMIVSGFFSGLSAGASAFFSRYFGAADYDTLRDSIHTTALFSAGFGAVLAGAGIAFSPALLKLTNCPEEILEMAVTYLQIYLIGVFFTCMYNIGSAVLRSVGDSRSPFVFLVVSSVLNIVLDILFVAVIPMGVSGVAMSTVIAEGISMILVFFKLTRLDPAYRFRFSRLTIKWKLLGRVARLGLPAGIQASIQAISALYVQSYTNSFSSLTIAGVGSAMRLDQFIGMPCSSLGLAMTTFIGQNIGAGKYERTHKAVGISTLSTAVYVIALGIPLYIFSPYLIRIFSPDPEVIAYGTGFLRVILPLYFLMGINQLFSGIVRGYGYSITAMVCMLSGYIAVRQIWLYVTLNFVAHDVRFLYWCYPVSWAAAAVSIVLVYLLVIRRKFPAHGAAS